MRYSILLTTLCTCILATTVQGVGSDTTQTVETTGSGFFSLIWANSYFILFTTLLVAVVPMAGYRFGHGAWPWEGKKVHQQHEHHEEGWQEELSLLTESEQLQPVEVSPLKHRRERLSSSVESRQAPKSAQKLIDLAKGFIEQRQFGKAGTSFQKAAAVEEQSGDNIKAQKLYQQAAVQHMEQAHIHATGKRHDMAAEQYEQAAIAYRAAYKALKEIEDQQHELAMYTHAAEQYHAEALLLANIQSHEGAALYFDKAASAYTRAGNDDSAATMTDGAKLMRFQFN